MRMKVRLHIVDLIPIYDIQAHALRLIVPGHAMQKSHLDPVHGSWQTICLR